jgi:hypothetical protein
MTKILKVPAKIDRVPSKEPNKKEPKKKRSKLRLKNDHAAFQFVFATDIKKWQTGGSTASKKFQPLF